MLAQAAFPPAQLAEGSANAPRIFRCISFLSHDFNRLLLYWEEKGADSLGKVCEPQHLARQRSVCAVSVLQQRRKQSVSE